MEAKDGSERERERGGSEKRKEYLS